MTNNNNFMMLIIIQVDDTLEKCLQVHMDAGKTSSEEPNLQIDDTKNVPLLFRLSPPISSPHVHFVYLWNSSHFLSLPLISANSALIPSPSFTSSSSLAVFFGAP